MNMPDPSSIVLEKPWPSQGNIGFLYNIVLLTSISTTASVSDGKYPRSEVERMGTWLQQQLIAVGVPDTQLVKLPDDPETGLPLPPLVIGRLGSDPSRKTVLVYGHYDVQPVRIPISVTGNALVVRSASELVENTGRSRWLGKGKPRCARPLRGDRPSEG